MTDSEWGPKGADGVRGADGIAGPLGVKGADGIRVDSPVLDALIAENAMRRAAFDARPRFWHRLFRR